MISNKIRIGTAGWSIPKLLAAEFNADGTHLQRYAQRFNAVEINSSFYRPHKPETYARWASSVPAGFHFAVKIPREITHTRKLIDPADPLNRFLTETKALGEHLGRFLCNCHPAWLSAKLWRPNSSICAGRVKGSVVCEPRHRSWFTDNVDELLAQLSIARVLADPAPVPRAAKSEDSRASSTADCMDRPEYTIHPIPRTTST